VAENVSTGFLVLADISGYTRYLTGVELEHSHDILADLLGLVADSLCPPLELAKLEGDAVFCFRRDDGSLDGDSLLASFEETYLAFARRRRTVALSSSCACKACRRVPDLDLKLFAHRGSFVEHHVAGSRELVGADVILVHRLLKNSVGESGGPHGYALLTDACAASSEAPERLERHVEHYEDIGEVACRVLNLGERWGEVQETTRVEVARDEAAMLFEADVAARPPAVWEAMTDPAHGMRWRVGVSDIRENHASSSRGAGTVTHCVHGRTTIRQEIVDWLPPHHVSFSERSPIGLSLWTMSLEPRQGGERTHMEWRIALRGGRKQALLMNVMGRRARKIIGENFEALVTYVVATNA
jgi:uncharacterized protein YndB with AHSA1/START domain